METILSLDSIDRFRSYMSERGVPYNTVKAYTTDLRMAYLQISPTPTTLDELQQAAAAWLTMNLSEVAPRTTRRRLQSFRRFGKFLGEDKFLTDYQAPSQPPMIPHPMEGGMDFVAAMVEAARSQHHKNMVALNCYCGLRIAEVLSVTADDFMFQGGDIKIKVTGKGTKVRYVNVGNLAWSVLAKGWIDAKKLDDKRLVPLGDRAARRAFTRIAKRAGGSGSTHDGRSTFATAAYYASQHDLAAVQELLGHASQDQTKGYVQPSDEQKRRATDF